MPHESILSIFCCRYYLNTDDSSVPLSHPQGFPSRFYNVAQWYH
jgi:hypothetical protein